MHVCGRCCPWHALHPGAPVPLGFGPGRDASLRRCFSAAICVLHDRDMRALDSRTRASSWPVRRATASSIPVRDASSGVITRTTSSRRRMHTRCSVPFDSSIARHSSRRSRTPRSGADETPSASEISATPAPADGSAGSRGGNCGVPVRRPTFHTIGASHFARIDLRKPRRPTCALRPGAGPAYSGTTRWVGGNQTD